ncbi:DUF1349 domain-containing protein [Planctomycetes bacterium K23_9]|uniref:Uncharacterized protein n=1 Tax=Stieleria marina TaxID=1930275 RepID=A0A517P2R5_9BACT|nr:hypothetical protein K239x_56580 [Planctomycetes bacterium K23_9]
MTIYRLIALLVVMVASPCLADEPQDDAIQHWGEVVDPDGDCAVTATGKELNIQFGIGMHSLDAESNGMNSPRVVQWIKGDFAIETTVHGDLPMPKLNFLQTWGYVSGGLVLIQNRRNYIRLERAGFTSGDGTWHYANFEQRIDAQRTRTGKFADFPVHSDKPVQLRLEVKGEDVRALVRHIGDDWHELGTAKMPGRVELYAGVSGVKTDFLKASVKFSDFDLTRNFVPVKAKSESDINLEQLRIFLRQPDANPDLKNVFRKVADLQSRGVKVGEMTEDQQLQLIDDAISLGTNKPAGLKGYLGPSIARKLAKNFQDAQLPEKAIRIYQKLADALETEQDASLKEPIDSLRKSAQEMLDELATKHVP